MSDPGRHINPGPMRDRHLNGIVAHGYSAHRKEFGGSRAVTPDAYRRSAEKLLSEGNIGHALKQANGTNYLIADRKLGTMAYLNAKNPNKSTHFAPTGGVDKHLNRKLNTIPPSDRQKLDLQKIRAAPATTKAPPKPPLPTSTTNSPKPPMPATARRDPPRPPAPNAPARPPAPRPAPRPAPPRPAMAKPPAKAPGPPAKGGPHR